MIRTSVREIAAQGRDATGVRVMNLDDGQTVAAVTKVPRRRRSLASNPDCLSPDWTAPVDLGIRGRVGVA